MGVRISHITVPNLGQGIVWTQHTSVQPVEPDAHLGSASWFPADDATLHITASVYLLASLPVRWGFKGLFGSSHEIMCLKMLCKWENAMQMWLLHSNLLHSQN